MRPLRSSLLYRFLVACAILGSAGILQWLLIGGANPFERFDPDSTARNGTARVTPAPIIVNLVGHHAKFQLGMVFPRWGSDAYSTKDLDWQNGLVDIYHQTRSQWIEMIVNLYQDSLTSTDVQVKSEMAPTPAALAEGIRMAHIMGYRVFVSVLLSVGGADPWAGSIHFSSPEQEQAWFTSYGKAVAPFVVAANQARAEQFAIGTEYEKLQQASPILWEQLISQFHHSFHGRLTYNINWSSLTEPIPSWMRNPNLVTIGVSVYIPLTDQAVRLNPATLPTLWRQKVKNALDTYAIQIGRPVLISEIGYRNRADALYDPWLRTTKAPVDPKEQAAAYSAALQNVIGDPHITGIFFWAWSFPVFQPNGLPTCKVMRQWYSSNLVK
jgi:hypothetical protein